MEINIEVSARHIHLSESDCIKLFGSNQLTIERELSQPGQYLASYKVAIKSGDKLINKVAVLGPFRKSSQVEISLTDSYKLNVKPPIRESGNLEGAPTITVLGSIGEVNIPVIIAQRHIHMHTSDAKRMQLSDKQVVSVELDTKPRSAIYKDVIIRVSDSFSLAMHIDTDEANAAYVAKGTIGRIIKQQ